jgi:hypothetical protein
MPRYDEVWGLDTSGSEQNALVNTVTNPEFAEREGMSWLAERL